VRQLAAAIQGGGKETVSKTEEPQNDAAAVSD